MLKFEFKFGPVKMTLCIEFGNLHPTNARYNFCYIMCRNPRKLLKGA